MVNETHLVNLCKVSWKDFYLCNARSYGV